MPETIEGMTLVEFLLARIAEDEALARDASTGQRWTWTEDGAELVSDHFTEYRTRECIIDTEGANPPGSGPTGQHIARHDPARVLAECESKRQIIAMHSLDEDRSTGLCLEDGFTHPCETVRLLTLPYASHPDCREEWRPPA